jgi:hypothetical protein
MNELVLTADQIYALAYILKAKYLDYYYIALANRINESDIWLSENTKRLVSQGILVEDFSGETTIDPDVEALIKPLYFSTKESSLDVNIFGDNEDNEGYRFHFLDGKVTMTKAVKEGFEISDVSVDDIRKIIIDLLPDSYSADSAKADISLDVSKVSRVFVVKNTEMNVKSYILTLVESDGVVYEEDPTDSLFSVSKTDFAEKLYKILTEV